MRKLTALFVASTLALGAANLAHAADTTTVAPADAKPMMHHKGKFGPHEDMMFKDLNLTDAQKQQIREIMKGQRDQMKRPPLEERRAMHDIIASDTFDKAKAEAQIAKMEEQRKANMLAHMETQGRPVPFLRGVVGLPPQTRTGRRSGPSQTRERTNTGLSARPRRIRELGGRQVPPAPSICIRRPPWHGFRTV